ncbi:AMP-binding protein [Roseibium sp.]|uniref:AMP-binding protein n=1 Tax=Roseibium sp. TaxID=1936156 RepID=UPI003A97ECD8
MTNPVRAVRTIEDIRAIETQPYDEVVTAHNLYDLFRATAVHRGDAPALTVLRSPDTLEAGCTLNHRQLLGEIKRAANMFRRLGIAEGKGSVAFMTPTVPELQALLIGAQVAGVASSLNYLLNRDTIAELMNAHGATVLVTAAPSVDENCWSKAEGLFDLVPTLERIIVIGAASPLPAGYIALDNGVAGCSTADLEFTPTATRDTVCALFHTGGTTGRPKLVQLTHGNQIHAAFGFGQVFGYDAQDTVINGFPFFHVGGTMTVGMSVLAAGGHMVVPSPYALRPPQVIERYWDLVQHFRATVVSGVPTSIASMTNTVPKGRDLSHVRMAVTGGAVLPRAVGTAFEKATGIKIYETYGMTETAAAIAFNPGRGTPMMGSVGFRAPFSQVRVVRQDTGDLAMCSPSEPGLVQIRGPQVFPGYHDPKQNTGVLDPQGWLTTGDIGYLTEDERLVLTGRAKDLIVRSGHNIDPAAIEDVANQFEGVAISAAVAMPDQYAGEVPALFVVPVPGTVIDIDRLADHMRTHVHEPPARPRSIVVIPSLPVTAVGKIFKPALRDLAIEEKVKLEVAGICAPGAVATIEIGEDERMHSVISVQVQGATAAELKALAERLHPLPQTYRITGDRPND